MDIDHSADNTERLIEKAKAEVHDQDIVPLITQTALEALKTIPGIGQVVAAGEQLRHRRQLEYLERSVEDLRATAVAAGSRLASVERSVDDERLTRLIHDGLTRSINARTDAQRHRIMRAVRNAVLSADDLDETNYDEQAWMLRTADEMAQTDVEVLVGAFRAAEREDFFAIPQDDDMRMAAIERLRSFGFLIAREQTSVALQGGVGRSGEISALGKRFVEFALDDAVS